MSLVMDQNDTLHVAQEFLRRTGSGAEPAEVTKVFTFAYNWKPCICPSGSPLGISW